MSLRGLVFAQESASPDALSLEELLNSKVYSASKYEQREAEAPSSISVISGDEIRRNGYRTLNEALRNVTGFYTKNHGSYTTMGVRGFAPPGDSNSRILLLVNGHAINNNIDDSAPLGNDFPLDMDLIDRIEIVRGPSSSLYGANAFFGVVNVIIRTGNNKGTIISGEAGSLGTYKGTAIYSLDRNGTQALFSASYWDTAAPSHLDRIEDPIIPNSANIPGGPGADNPIGYKNGHDQTRRVFALVSSHGFTLQAAVSSSQEKVPSSAQWCGSCHQTDTHTTNFRGYADLQYEHRGWWGTQLTARAYYDTYETHGKYNDLRNCQDAQCHGPLVNYDNAHGDRVGGELKLSRRFLDRHRITLGADYRDNFRQAQHNYYYTPATSSLPVTNFIYNRTSALWGIYGEGEIRVHPKLILNVGLRTDLYNYSVGSSINPRAALIFTPRKSTTLKFLYATAFRAPSFSERYSAGMASLPAPDLKPENIRTFEGVWEQQLSKRVTLSAAGFYNHIGSYIESQQKVVNGHDGPIDVTEFFNSKATARGAELELKGKLPSGAEGRLSYTYQDAHNDAANSPLPDAPKHLAKLNVATPLFRRMITPAVEAQYMSRSSTLWPATKDSAPPVLLNISVSSRSFWGGLSLSGGAYNLVGRSMSPPTIGYFEQILGTIPSTSLLPDDRRSFRLKLTWASSEHADKGKSQQHTEGGH